MLEMTDPTKPNTALEASFWQREGAEVLCTLHSWSKPRIRGKVDLVTILNSW